MGEWVSDAPAIMAAATRKELNQRLDELDAMGGGQMAIVCLEDLSPVPSAPEAYGRFTERLFDHWGIGRAGINDGVLLAIFRSGRRVEVRTGAGARDVLSDEWLAAVQQRDMLPFFRAQDYDAGIELGARRILDRLVDGVDRPPIVGERVPKSSREGQLLAEPDNTVRGFGAGRVLHPPVKRVTGVGSSGVLGPLGNVSEADRWGSMSLVALAIAVVGAAFAALVHGDAEFDRRRRQCYACGVDDKSGKPRSTMDRIPSELDGTADLGADYPVRLSACEADERRLGSVRFELLRCATCGAERVLQTARRRTLDGHEYAHCAKCKCRCSRQTDTVQRAPTEHTTGVAVHLRQCAHCGQSERWRSELAKHRPISSSGGGGGGGGFGGGFGGGTSQGGGGAGASWVRVPEAETWIEWIRQATPNEHAARMADGGRAIMIRARTALQGPHKPE